ncbi:dienelactone hydrolase family protein [Novosphingobium sp. TH158]|uniref:dienelactone hydrolase family protein n=1 Tax=Novosphingobium sp. TH158 TaxID=2067455 RepID=UPI000C7DCAC1|nr:dienelactone hydrolase family protein [Novosphingobium sp. TH158]PLK26213.1 dienelactone hydrolase [Novosphingobium sp. TH158]
MQELIPVYLEHDGTVLTGQAAMPKGLGPFPAVMVMHNALGIGPHVREVAGRLSALGYVAVATDMYGGGAPASEFAANTAAFERITGNPDLLRDRVCAWFERVSGMVEVVPDRVAAIGFCFGGTCVLELARSGAPARAVVSYHGILTSDRPMRAAAFPGAVQAWCGAQDPYAPLDHIEGLRAELEAAGANYTITTFGDAAHGFTDPAADSMGRPGIAYNAMAERISWAGTVAMLDSVMKA